MLHALDAHLKGATPDYTAQYRTRLGNGNWRWILARGQVAERDGDGLPFGATVLSTPGHTAGHIALLLHRDGRSWRRH